jgi:carboxymethylenebutenolidase
MTAQPRMTGLASDIVGLTKAPDLSRRNFFMTASAAAAAGYTLAAGPVRADAIKTPTDGLKAGDAKVKVADGEMPVYYARPANATNPPVILVAMEIFGLHEYIKDVTRRLGKLGALAVAPDDYFRRGDLTKITEMPQLMPLVNAKPDAELFSDLDATVPGRSSRAATPAGSASWASAAAGARCGNIPRIIPTSRPVSPSTERWSIPPIRDGRRARPSWRPR